MAKTRSRLILKPKLSSKWDCVLMRPLDIKKWPYRANIEGIETDAKNDVKVRLRWYCRPEEVLGSRRQFHMVTELFLSNNYNVQSAHTTEGKCIVHPLKNYTKLDNIGIEDYYYRFEYKAATRGFTSDHVAVCCKREMRHSPDD